MKENTEKIPKSKVSDCFVKNTKKARLHFISKFTLLLLRHKDKEHIERYEKLWQLYDNDYPNFLTTTYHNITEDEFTDFVVIMQLSHYRF